MPSIKKKKKIEKNPIFSKRKMIANKKKWSRPTISFWLYTAMNSLQGKMSSFKRWKRIRCCLESIQITLFPLNSSLWSCIGWPLLIEQYWMFLKVLNLSLVSHIAKIFVSRGKCFFKALVSNFTPWGQSSTLIAKKDNF